MRALYNRRFREGWPEQAYSNCFGAHACGWLGDCGLARTGLQQLLWSHACGWLGDCALPVPACLSGLLPWCTRKQAGRRSPANASCRSFILLVMQARTCTSSGADPVPHAQRSAACWSACVACPARWMSDARCLAHTSLAS